MISALILHNDNISLMSSIRYVSMGWISQVLKGTYKYCWVLWVQVANHLYCGAKVVGGHEEALAFLEQNKDDFKIRKIRRKISKILSWQCFHYDNNNSF